MEILVDGELSEPVEQPARDDSEVAGTTVDDADVDAIEEAIEELAIEHGVAATLDERVMRLDDPVKSPHLAVLQALGFAAKVGPVGAAAHGPAGVAAAVWRAPELHIVRWTGTSRWVAAYKFPARARPDEYLREDTGIPSHLGKGNWYGDVPEEITEVFFSVGLLLDEPPYPVPQPPPPPPTPEPAPKKQRAPAAPREPRPPRAPRKRASTAAPKKVAMTTRTCTGCNLQKHISQFVADSDLCVDCR